MGGNGTTKKFEKAILIQNDEALKDSAGQLNELNLTNVKSTKAIQDDYFRAGHAKKRKDQKMSLENFRVM